MKEFVPFPKIPRLSREIIVTEKLDGTNASIYIGDDGEFLVGSRTRWITPEADNYGFANWAYANEEELRKLGEGHHFGEWWGQGIQRNYARPFKTFSLFNTTRWKDDPNRPVCVSVVPELFRGDFDTNKIRGILKEMEREGSIAAPGFMKPEGIVIFHTASREMYKKTIEKDDKPKGSTE